jgi:uncharacterized protein (TIGR03083 family)
LSSEEAMPRPTTRATLLRALDEERARLEALIATLDPAQMTVPGVVGDWSVKDVLAHLTAWQQMCLGWYGAGRRGESPRTPADDLSWRQIPEVNERIYQAHKGDALDEVLLAFRASGAETRAAIEGAADAELFGPNVYAWTRTSTLGAYFVSCTSSHDAWACAALRKGLKARRA